MDGWVGKKRLEIHLPAEMMGEKSSSMIHQIKAPSHRDNKSGSKILPTVPTRLALW